MERHREPNMWWVSVDGEVLEEPMPLERLSTLDLDPGRNKVRLLPVNYVGKDERWFRLELESRSLKRRVRIDEAEQREAKVRRVRLWIALAIAIVLPLPVALGLYYGVQWWLEETREIAPEDVIVTTYDKPLMALANKTDSVVMVLNRGARSWPEVEIWLNGKPGYGYYFKWTDAVPPDKALNAPIRLFRNPAGERLFTTEDEIDSIYVKVPDYKDWSFEFTGP